MQLHDACLKNTGCQRKTMKGSIDGDGRISDALVHRSKFICE